MWNALRHLLGKKTRVLVVEDDDEIAGLLTLYLRTRGWIVDRARDGVEGDEKALRTRPTIILMDITMPKMDGKQLLLSLKSRDETRGIPVIMVTDHGSLQDVEQCCRWGADGYVLKPFEMEKVLEKIQSVLGAR